MYTADNMSRRAAILAVAACIVVLPKGATAADAHPASKEAPRPATRPVVPTAEQVRRANGPAGAERERAAGELLPMLRPDMTQPEVEAWLGKPVYFTRDSKALSQSMYYARLDATAGTSIMTVHYELKDGVQWFTHYAGPHKPD